MDAQQFLAEFGHIANAPSGIDRLRDMVLDLAIQGRLILSSESKESTLGLLAEIRRWKANQTQSKKGRRATVEAPISDLEKPFSIPDHWIWVRNSDIFSLAKGKNPKDLSVDGEYPYLDIEALDRGNIQRYTNDEQAPRSSKTDILVVCDGSRSGLVLDGNDGVIGSTLARIDTLPAIQPFVKLLFLHGYRRLNAEKKGAAIPHLDTARLLARPCGLPPVSDQESIIAKVDELMALCDKLEAQQQARRKLQNALRQSTLQAVASATSPHELQTTWTRLAENFGRLCHAPEDVVEIKSLILDLAIQGLLADRQLDDEPAEMLVSRSLEAKRVRLASGEMKNKKPSATDIVDVEINIPAHWKRASLDELFQFIDYRGKTPAKTNSGVVLVTAKNVRPGLIANEPVEFLSESSYQTWMTRGFPRIGDLLITTEAPLGNVARIEEQPSFAIAQRVIDLQPFADLNTKCAMYFMMSPLFQSLLDENSTGMTAKGIKAGKLKQLILPIPPREEQQRIVQRVEELMNICSLLSSQLEMARRQSTRLAVAAVSSLTGIAIEQEEEPMKAPQTELIAPLRLGTAPDVKAQAPLATILARQNGEMSAKDLWQRFGGEIDAFYAQLKTEVAHGWILEPAPAEMRERQADAVSA